MRGIPDAEIFGNPAAKPPIRLDHLILPCRQPELHPMQQGESNCPDPDHHHQTGDERRPQRKIIPSESQGKHDEERAWGTKGGCYSKRADEHDPVRAGPVAYALAAGESLLDGGHIHLLEPITMMHQR